MTVAYLAKISKPHNKYLTDKYLEGNDFISAKSAAQILTLNLAQTFLLLPFLVACLCTSCAGT